MRGERPLDDQNDYSVELLVPFLKDQGGWEQLVNVLESWSKTVPASAPLVSQQLKEMESLLDG